MLRFPMTACPMSQDNSYPLVQDECPPAGEVVSRSSITHEATVMKTVGRSAASSLTLVDRTSGFWDGPAENTLAITHEAQVVPVRFGVASNSLGLSQTNSVAGGKCPCGAGGTSGLAPAFRTESEIKLTQQAHVLKSIQLLSLSPLDLEQRANATNLLGNVASTPYTVTTVASNTTLGVGNQIILVNAASGEVQITLPSVSLMEGKVIHIKKIDSSGFQVVIATPGSETIDGASEQRIQFQWTSGHLSSDGTAWYLL